MHRIQWIAGCIVFLGISVLSLSCQEGSVQLNSDELMLVEERAQKAADSLQPTWDAQCVQMQKDKARHVYDSIYAARQKYIQEKLGSYGNQQH
jgi:hypothetical protein